jgi:hypothetical protein
MYGFGWPYGDMEVVVVDNFDKDLEEEHMY